MSNSLESELKERLHFKSLEKIDEYMGQISQGLCYKTHTGQKIFVKLNGSKHAAMMYEGEKESLDHILATKTIRVPKPFIVIHNYDDTNSSAIAMEHIELRPITSKCDKLLARKLARLHKYNSNVIKFTERASRWVGHMPPSSKPIIESRSKAAVEEDSCDDASTSDETKQQIELENRLASYTMDSEPTKEEHEVPDDEYAEKFVPQHGTEAIEQFGFHVPTSCGLIPQVNEWADEWIPFFARHRLDHTIRAILSDHGDRSLVEEWSKLQIKIGKFFEDYEPKGEGEIVPSLLHGDLWSGNVSETHDGTDAIIYDASSFYGHSEYEFGIIRMFSGFGRDFERTYFELVPKKRLFEKRVKLYTLFHHLNHWNHFGSSYRNSSLNLIKDLNALVASI